MFEEAFYNCLNEMLPTVNISERLWLEIRAAYSAKGRHYHNLLHLDNLLNELKPVKESLINWNLIVLGIGYHDFVYDSKRSDNEEKSAEKFVSLFSQHFNEALVEQGSRMILATRGHTKTFDNDIDYFTNADLSILGASPENYAEYSRQIRKEYSVYPDFMYNRGRKKVLQHFLKMETIFNTDYFFQPYEDAARLNLQHELNSL